MTVINGDHLWVMAQGGGGRSLRPERAEGVYALDGT
jgi:hypothetical protein